MYRRPGRDGPSRGARQQSRSSPLPLRYWRRRGTFGGTPPLAPLQVTTRGHLPRVSPRSRRCFREVSSPRVRALSVARDNGKGALKMRRQKGNTPLGLYAPFITDPSRPGFSARPPCRAPDGGLKKAQLDRRLPHRDTAKAPAISGPSPALGNSPWPSRTSSPLGGSASRRHTSCASMR